MADVTQPTSDQRTGSRPSGARVIVLGITFKLTMIFHLGVLARQCPITLGYSAPAFDERVQAIVQLVRLHEPHVRRSQGNRPWPPLMATAPGG